MKKRQWRRIGLLMVALTLLMAVPSAQAVTVLTPEKTDYADRLTRAERSIRERLSCDGGIHVGVLQDRRSGADCKR